MAGGAGFTFWVEFYDPEDGEWFFELLQQPEHGILALMDEDCRFVSWSVEPHKGV